MSTHKIFSSANSCSTDIISNCKPFLTNIHIPQSHRLTDLLQQAKL